MGQLQTGLTAHFDSNNHESPHLKVTTIARQLKSTSCSHLSLSFRPECALLPLLPVPNNDTHPTVQNCSKPLG